MKVALIQMRLDGGSRSANLARGRRMIEIARLQLRTGGADSPVRRR